MQDVYDLIVIGAGAAGLTAAGFGGRVNARVALIEKHKLGGDCTWYGCVPSKALLKVGKVAHAVRTAAQYGIAAGQPVIDMQAVRAYVQQTIEEIYQHETPEVFAEAYGVEVILGEAQFIDSNTVQVGDHQLAARKIIIATGARALIPPVKGLAAVPYVTNETIFQNDVLPQRLLIMGAGPIGMEMAQAYARLGSRVTVMDRAMLPRDEPEAVGVMARVFEREGIQFIASLIESVQMDDGEFVAVMANGEQVRGDMFLVAAGRQPNVESLSLENAGVVYSSAGIEVDTYLRTNVKHIYAIGDCTTGPKFTHYAGSQGGVAAQNALFPVVNSKGHDPILPWVTFTDPEVAHVGLTEAEARKKYKDAIKTFVLPLTKGDRSIAENDKDGFIKLVYKNGGKLLGATIVAERAGEMITEFALVLKTDLKLRDIVNTMHAYPTYSDIVRKAVSSMLIEELFDGFSGKVVNAVTKTII